MDDEDTPKEVKTVRFAQIVKEAGTPEPYTVWEDPEKDPGLKKAIREGRVVTVMQKTAGTTRDYGLVGFHKEQGASYLIFPKSLQKFEGKRIIGVKYDLVGKPKPVGPVVNPEELKPKIPPRKVAQVFEPKVLPRPEVTEEQKPRLKKFAVVIVATAQVQLEEEVEAENQNGAKRLAEERIRQNKPDFSKGEIRIQATTVKSI